ncbi:MAG: amidohydrolase family protein [Bacteroidales bacterium]|nr:amidohydrolase family protein [Candidatus Liminaster caballi]
MERIDNVNILTPDGAKFGSVVIGDDGLIAGIDIQHASDASTRQYPCLLPGLVDGHVHFREPGLTHKADIASESRAAAAGGVTTVLDMPNVNPTTTSPEALADKHRRFAADSVVSYGIWYGITADNVEQALRDYGMPDSPHRDEICGFKVFLGSSTGGMLMNDEALLRHLFSATDRVIGIHSESEDIIRRNRQHYCDLVNMQLNGSTDRPIEDLPIEYHPKIRDVEACMHTTRMAVELALETGANLHVCHLTTAEEVEYLRDAMAKSDGRITCEVTPAHLMFSQEDYRRLGTRIKCNPAIKRVQDRDALRLAAANGIITTVGTDHAPHLLSDKQGGALRAASGMPSIQFSLLSLLELHDQGLLSLSRIVELTAAAPARRFGLADRGEICVGKRADLVLVSSDSQTTVTGDIILSKCGWSPFEGHTFNHRIISTWVNGTKVY